MKYLLCLFFLTYASCSYGQQSIFQKDTVRFLLYHNDGSDTILHLTAEKKPDILPFAASFFIDKEALLHTSYELSNSDIPNDLIAQKTVIDLSEKGLENRYLYKYVPFLLDIDIKIWGDDGTCYLKRKDKGNEFSIAYFASSTRYLPNIINGIITQDSSYQNYLNTEFHKTYYDNNVSLKDTVLIIHNNSVPCYINQESIENLFSTPDKYQYKTPEGHLAYRFLTFYVERSTMLPVLVKLKIVIDKGERYLPICTEYFLIPEGLDIKL